MSLSSGGVKDAVIVPSRQACAARCAAVFLWSWADGRGASSAFTDRITVP